jgi:hypothetical protein
MKIVIDYGVPGHRRHFERLSASLAAREIEVTEVASYYHTLGYSYFEITGATHNDFALLHGKYDSRPVGHLRYLLRCLVDALHYHQEWANNFSFLRERAVNMLVHALNVVGGVEVNRDSVCNELGSLSKTKVSSIINFLTEIDSRIPASPATVNFVRSYSADVWVFTQLVFTQYAQSDYLLAAKQLGIPTVYTPFSWDNLTTKGRLSIAPDHFLAWNQNQLRELSFHGFDVNSLNAKSIGSFRFEVNQASGFEPLTASGKRKVRILYLGSSNLVSLAEEDFFVRWYESIRSASDSRLSSALITLRPHPRNYQRFLNNIGAVSEGISVSKPTGINDTQSLNKLLRECDLVVASNTSAELEAAMAGHVIFTVVGANSNRELRQTFHFQHLSDEKSGIKILAEDLDTHVCQLVSCLDEPARYTGKAQRFVESFIFGGDMTCSVEDKFLRYLPNILHKRPERSLESANRRFAGSKDVIDNLAFELAYRFGGNIFLKLLGALRSSRG